MRVMEIDLDFEGGLTHLSEVPCAVFLCHFEPMEYIVRLILLRQKNLRHVLEASMEARDKNKRLLQSFPTCFNLIFFIFLFVFFLSFLFFQELLFQHRPHSDGNKELEWWRRYFG